jgi:hypothetical protein
VPAVLQNSVYVIPEQVASYEWYAYRQNRDGITVNGVLNFGRIGRTLEPVSGVPAEAQSISIRYYRQNEQTCTYAYWVGLHAVSGKLLGDDFDADDISPANFYTVYIDYNLFKIVYGCAKILMTGQCQQPIFFVSTRKNTLQLTPGEMAQIDSITDRVLAPFCSSAGQLTLQAHSNQTSYCPPETTVPPCWTMKIQGYANITTPLQTGPYAAYQTDRQYDRAPMYF